MGMVRVLQVFFFLFSANDTFLAIIGGPSFPQLFYKYMGGFKRSNTPSQNRRHDDWMVIGVLRCWKGRGRKWAGEVGLELLAVQSGMEANGKDGGHFVVECPMMLLGGGLAVGE
jgi:hypothetical protein